MFIAISCTLISHLSNKGKEMLLECEQPLLRGALRDDTKNCYKVGLRKNLNSLHNLLVCASF